MFLRRSDDRLEFTGRSDDLLKVSGQWVSTLWIEHALAEAGGDAIEQVAAVGVPTPDGLTTIAALMVAVPGREDEAKLRIDASIGKLPMYRRPRWVHWVRELPLTATGKVQRSRLRDAHESALIRIVEIATTAALFDRPQHPYTRMLLEAVPDLQAAGGPGTAVAGEVPNPLDPPSGCAFHPRCPRATERCRRATPVLRMHPVHGVVACHAVEGRVPAR